MAKLIDYLCHDVEIEPLLQPLQGQSFDNQSNSREEGARLDIKPNYLRRNRSTPCFFDVRILNTSGNSTLSDSNANHKNFERNCDTRNAFGMPNTAGSVH